MAQHIFYLKGTWSGNRLGEGRIEAGGLSSVVTVPTQMGGPGVGTNPDDMLLGSAATCYMITLASVLDNRKLPVVEFTLNSELIISDEGGLHVQSITHRPHLVLAADATPEQLDMAEKATHRAEQACMISKALKGNVELHVEPTISKQ
jgi:peroxiredoxin-like protein